jgi:hypothetical protein
VTGGFQTETDVGTGYDDGLAREGDCWIGEGGEELRSKKGGYEP